MKQLFLLAVALISFSCLTAQQNEIKLTTNYGSDNKEIHDILRFEGLEKINLKFAGTSLKGKNYSILIKEYTNGSLSKTDTIISSKADDYIKPIDKDIFEFRFLVKTRLDNTIKMTSMFNRFSNTKIFDIKTTKDYYALHDFLNGKEPMTLNIGKPTYIMGYFLPYVDEETGWKKYCDVAGSKYSPEDWGKVFNIPNYFLIEVLFE